MPPGGTLGDKASQGQQALPFNSVPVPKATHRNSVYGDCILKNKEVGTVQTPCPVLTLRLEDEKGSKYLTTTTMDGQYEFSNVPANQKLFIRVDSKKYKINIDRVGPVVVGDPINIIVVKK